MSSGQEGLVIVKEKCELPLNYTWCLVHSWEKLNLALSISNVSQNVVYGPWECSRFFQGVCEIKTIFIIIERSNCFFHGADTVLTDGTKVTVSKTAQALVGVKTVALNCISSCIL